MASFDDEHQWPTTIEDNDEIMETIDGIEGDFDNCLANAEVLAERLIKVMELVAAGDCLGCRNVICRISMLIEDLEVEARFHDQA